MSKCGSLPWICGVRRRSRKTSSVAGGSRNLGVRWCASLAQRMGVRSIATASLLQWLVTKSRWRIRSAPVMRSRQRSCTDSSKVGRQTRSADLRTRQGLSSRAGLARIRSGASRKSRRWRLALLSLLLEEPLEEIGASVRGVPGIVIDSRQLGVLDIGPDRLESRKHAPRLVHVNIFVGIAVEDPNGQFCHALGEPGIRISIGHDSGIEHSAGLAAKFDDKTADGHHSGKAIVIMRGEEPSAVAASGVAGEIDARGIAVEFGDRVINGGQSRAAALLLPSRFVVGVRLRKNDDGREAFGVLVDGPR